MMKICKRKVYLSLCLIATLGVVFFAPEKKDELVLATESTNISNGDNENNEAKVRQVFTLRSRNDDAISAMPFQQKEWQVKENVSALNVVLKSDKVIDAQVPVLPFRVFGGYIEDGRLAAFLVYGERNLVVQEGDIIESIYRVESLNENEIVFVYLPLGKKQSMTLGNKVD